ncbi:hypothetical protein [Rufibacter sp. XAAS-G3-1]|nr:hypothetical protein [Rufibacter sp. XAAS-G3-1]
MPNQEMKQNTCPPLEMLWREAGRQNETNLQKMSLEIHQPLKKGDN